MIRFRIAAENKSDRSVHRAIAFANVGFKTVKISPGWKYFLGKAENLSQYCLVVDTGTCWVGGRCVWSREGFADGWRGRECLTWDRCDRWLWADLNDPERGRLSWMLWTRPPWVIHSGYRVRVVMEHPSSQCGGRTGATLQLLLSCVLPDISPVGTSPDIT